MIHYTVCTKCFKLVTDMLLFSMMKADRLGFSKNYIESKNVGTQ